MWESSPELGVAVIGLGIGWLILVGLVMNAYTRIRTLEDRVRGLEGKPPAGLPDLPDVPGAYPKPKRTMWD
jgi:hypothetical protein